MSVKRNQADPAFMWDLTDIYKDRVQWESDTRRMEQAIEQLAKMPGTLRESAESLRRGLDEIYGVMEIMSRVYAYAALNAAGDNGDTEAQNMSQLATQLYVNLSAAIAFVDPEILSIDPETLDAWMKSDDLASYRHILEDTVRMRAHTLSDKEEQLLALMGDAAGTPDNAFTMLESVDMKFEPLSGDRPLTHGLFGVYRDSADPATRAEAFEKYFGEFNKMINTITALYSGSVKFDSYRARVRNYSGALEAALAANNIPALLYDNLIGAVHDALPVLDRYLKLRKRLMGLDTLSLYDLYVPLVGDVDEKIPFERAKAMVLEALRPMGEEYGRLLNRAFDERWIDVYENEGKTTGAFSYGVHGVHPYVLLNYTGSYNDVFTLAHELGHAMHSWFSSRAQDYANHDYRIFVAEVASTVNEVMLTRYLLSTETDPAKRAYILNHLLEGFRTTVFRQTLFAEFEKRTHEMYESGEPLTAQSLNGVYRDLNETYYAAAKGTELTDVEWARIPHFYNAFYVYQYATGFCSAVAIADSILKGEGIERYLKFLSTGGSMYPLDELKIAGVDLTTPEPVHAAMRVFDETLSDFEQAMSN